MGPWRQGCSSIPWHSPGRGGESLETFLHRTGNIRVSFARISSTQLWRMVNAIAQLWVFLLFVVLFYILLLNDVNMCCLSPPERPCTLSLVFRVA